MYKLIKDEMYHRYGDFMVIAYTTEREPSNSSVKWLCECVHCHREILRNGNLLRFNRGIYCPSCNYKGRKRRYFVGE